MAESYQPPFTIAPAIIRLISNIADGFLRIRTSYAYAVSTASILANGIMYSL